MSEPAESTESIVERFTMKLRAAISEGSEYPWQYNDLGGRMSKGLGYVDPEEGFWDELSDPDEPDEEKKRRKERAEELTFNYVQSAKSKLLDVNPKKGKATFQMLPHFKVVDGRVFCKHKAQGAGDVNEQHCVNDGMDHFERYKDVAEKTWVPEDDVPYASILDFLCTLRNSCDSDIFRWPHAAATENKQLDVSVHLLPPGARR